MQFSAAQIALITNGRVEGDANTKVGSIGKIEEATEGELTFLANPKYEEYLYLTRASIIIVNEGAGTEAANNTNPYTSTRCV
jgi:UDP-3-O-[3-hydroxymyristoyl] glucosamine N-acyltransferase